MRCNFGEDWMIRYDYFLLCSDVLRLQVTTTPAVSLNTSGAIPGTIMVISGFAFHAGGSGRLKGVCFTFLSDYYIV